MYLFVCGAQRNFPLSQSGIFPLYLRLNVGKKPGILRFRDDKKVVAVSANLSEIVLWKS
jgi:hypothetical protein